MLDNLILNYFIINFYSFFEILKSSNYKNSLKIKRIFSYFF